MANEWEDVTNIYKAFPPDVAPTMMKVMQAESSGNPNAVNVNKNRTQDSGLFQINDIHLPELKKQGIITAKADLFNPEINAQAAAYLYSKSGTQPWNSSKTKWDSQPQNDWEDITSEYEPQPQPQTNIPTPQEQATLTHGGPAKVTTYGSPSWQQTTSNIARPVLQALGMVGGGLVGSGATPIAGTVAGAALGYAAGEQGANKLDELLGLRQPKPIAQELLQAGKDVGTGAAMEMGGQAAGVAIPAVVKALGKSIAKTLGVATGTGGGAIEEAFMNHPGFKQGMSGAISEEDIVKSMAKKLNTLNAEKSAAYAEGVQNLKTDVPLSPQSIEDSLISQLKQFGGNITKKIPDEYKEFWGILPADMKDDLMKGAKNVLDLKAVRGGGAVKQAATDALEALNNFKDVGDFTPYGFDTLRMQLRDIASQSKQAQAILSPVMEDIRSSVSTVVPEYRTMLSNYEKASNQISEMQKALSIVQEGKSLDTPIRKVATIFRDINKYRLAQLDELDPGGELRAQAAGVAMNDWLPRGQLSRLLHLGSVGGVGMLLHNAPLAAGLLTVSSPKVVGSVANELGQIPLNTGIATALARSGMLTKLGSENSKLSPTTNQLQQFTDKYAPLLSPDRISEIAGMNPSQRQGAIAKSMSESMFPILMTMPETRSIIMANKALGKPLFEGIPKEALDEAMNAAQGSRAIQQTQQGLPFSGFIKSIIGGK